VRRLFSAGRLLALGLVLVAVVLGLAVVPSNDYIFLPDPAHPVAPLVTVPGGHDPAHGAIYFVDVVVRKASLLERILGGRLHHGADVFPASAVNPPGVDDAQRAQIDVQDMSRSEQIAAAVALKAAGKKVTLKSTGARVDLLQPGMPAVGKLQPDDVLTAVNGVRVRSPQDVHNTMSRYHVGDVVRFTVLRGTKELVIPIRTVAASAKEPHRPAVGVFLTTALDIQLPIEVRIDAGNVGGPSAGLAFALQVYMEEGHDILHGHRVAATGEIFADGSVWPIGGVKQKTIGARDAGVDAFLVPAGENAREARKYAGGLRIIPVESFPQALRALATLAPVA
jgi:PDZ domain-containing protein